MAEYTSAQIQAMQQDAMRRVREMHRRSQGNINQAQYAPPPPPPPPPVPEPEPPPPAPIPKEEPQSVHSENPKKADGLAGILGGILPDIQIDEEKALIIILLIILARNGAQMKLLLALGYLLM